MNCVHTLIAYYKMREMQEAINLQKLIASEQNDYSKSTKKVSCGNKNEINKG